jgi:hypothetical protein
MSGLRRAANCFIVFAADYAKGNSSFCRDYVLSEHWLAQDTLQDMDTTLWLPTSWLETTRGHEWLRGDFLRSFFFKILNALIS